MKLNLFQRRQNAPAGVMQRLSKLQPPPTELTRQVLRHKHEAKNYRVGGIQPFDRAVKNFSWWCHSSGYTHQDTRDYLVYVLGVRFVTRPGR